MSTPYVRFWYAIAVAFVACLITAMGSVFYASRVQAESDRRWCALLVDLDAAYRGPPQPTTELGRKVAAEVHRLRVGFGCPER